MENFTTRALRYFPNATLVEKSACSEGESWGWIRKEINSISAFWHIGTINNLMQGTIQRSFNHIFFFKFGAFHWNVDARNQASSYGEHWVWISRWINFKSTFWIFGLPWVWSKEGCQRILILISFHRFEASLWDSDRRNEVRSYGRRKF